jgi:hypothetical protein
MAAGLESLRHHSVGAGLLRGVRFGQRRRGGEPRNAGRLQRVYVPAAAAAP